VDLILEGSRFPPGSNGPGPTPQTMLDTGQGSEEERRQNARTLEQGPPPQRPSTRQQTAPASKYPASADQQQALPLDQQQQAGLLDQQQRTVRQDKANRVHQDRDSHTLPGSSSQKQLIRHQPPASRPQAPLPTAQPRASTNGKKTQKTKKKAINHYWPKIFCQGE
jgi:hypothetical protein